MQNWTSVTLLGLGKFGPAREKLDLGPGQFGPARAKLDLGPGQFGLGPQSGKFVPARVKFQSGKFVLARVKFGRAKLDLGHGQFGLARENWTAVTRQINSPGQNWAGQNKNRT